MLKLFYFAFECPSFKDFVRKAECKGFRKRSKSLALTIKEDTVYILRRIFADCLWFETFQPWTAPDSLIPQHFIEIKTQYYWRIRNLYKVRFFNSYLYNRLKHKVFCIYFARNFYFWMLFKYIRKYCMILISIIRKFWI